MSSHFLERLTESVLLVDGAMGTQLQVHGLPVGEPGETFNLSHPEIVMQIHREYVQAGADIILTNTFGGNRLKLDANHLADKLAEINRIAVELACEAAQDQALVAASIGPTGQFLAPLGSISRAQMIDVFTEQIRVMVENGIDLVCIETMTDPYEAECAILAAKEVTDLPIIASMTYEHGKSGYRTLMGNDVANCVQILSDAGADVLATNCGYGINPIIEIIAEMRQATDKPLMAEPNAGLPELVNGQTIYNETAQMMAARLPQLLDAGVRVVGGCCGTSPKYIKAFRQVIDSR